MRKASAAWATTLFFFLAPGVVAGVVPWLITRWRFTQAGWEVPGVRWVGAVLVLVAVAALIECFARFALRGGGTPAPVAPTEILIVGGLYRFVRNPMYVAVFAIILGQGLLFGSGSTLLYAACVWIGFTAFVIFYEEPTLRGRYGEQYTRYCRHVHRWIPRLTPWNGL